MSIGIKVYYRLKTIGDDKIVYEYSGADINKEYDLQKLLSYDGVIEIKIYALKNKDSTTAFRDNDISIVKECEYEWHHKRLMNGKQPIGYFALRAISKIFREYDSNNEIVTKGAVIY